MQIRYDIMNFLVQQFLCKSAQKMLKKAIRTPAVLSDKVNAFLVNFFLYLPEYLGMIKSPLLFHKLLYLHL